MDSTSLWVIWQKYQSRALTMIAVIAAFIAGWYLGTVGSPYSSATPIVFEEIKSEALPQGSVAAVQGLQQAGIAARPSPAVAGAQTSKAPVPIPDTAFPFVASKNSTLYHHVTCSAAKRILPANLKKFTTEDEAKKAGFTPSACALEWSKK